MSKSIAAYLEPLEKAFEGNADDSIASGAKSYMKNVSEFYGIPAPLRRSLLKQFISENGYPQAEQLDDLISHCWQMPQREWQYIAMELAEKLIRGCDDTFLTHAEFMITNKSWWDTVDFVSPNIVGFIFKKYPETRNITIEKWMLSGNKWLQRACLLHQLRYGANTDMEMLFALCERLAAHPDFFIRKAIGWSLRQYSKFNAADVRTFVQTHTLSPLSCKEALKVVGAR